jgi:hypothetical protein
MKNQIICDICHSEMIFKERVHSKKYYRIRRFECSGCGHQQTIYAEGIIDFEITPKNAIKEVDKNFKKETKNREL